MPDRGKNIDDAKQKAIDSLNARIDEMGKAAYDILLKAIEQDFDFKAGKFEVNKDFVKQLNKLSVDVLDLLQREPKFTGPVSQFVKRLQPISEEISSFQKQVNGINVPAFETVKKVIQDEIIDKMLDNGLNQNFVQPLRDLVFQNATSGLSLSDAKVQLKEYINGGKDVSGKLGRYLEQTAEQAVDSYSGLINKKLLENFEYDGQLITGSLIDNSSPQCKYAIEKLGGKITRENWPDLVAHVGQKFPLVKGTNFDNLPQNKLHHGCRHNFYPIIIKKAN